MESGVPSLIIQRALRWLSVWILSLFYEVKIEGGEKLPDGGVLLLPNHLTWVDALLLQLCCPRPIRFLVYEEIYNLRALNPILRLFGALPVSSKRASGAVRASVEALRRGEVVCLFPEGELSRTGVLLRLKRGFEIIAREAQCPVVPVWLDQLWGSIFSFADGKFFFKWPRQIPYPVTVAFGEVIPAANADVWFVRERLLELGEWCYQNRPRMSGHLGREALHGLKARRRELAIIDGMDESTLSRGMLLSLALALAGELRRSNFGQRIGIVLPSGKGAVIANLAVVLAGKVPVNLNFTAGRFSLEAAIRIAELEGTITARSFEEKLGDFPWTKEIIYLERVIPALRGRIALWRGIIEILPAGWIARVIGLPKVGDRKEAVVLFTSGSAGEPKGVVLSHRNVLGNVSQCAMLLALKAQDKVLACLPIFHSFGSTVTLWYPILEGIQMVTYPSPLDVSRNAELIEKYGVTLLASTPTFLRGYLRKVEPDQLRSLELIITGAERLPMELADAFEARFGKPVLQGYGLTETAPVASVNLPDPIRLHERHSVQTSHRRGSVGKLAPGMAAQVRCPETGRKLALHETGMLWFKGPNIFEGYLRDPERTAAVLSDGWFKSGDLGRYDEDGFLYIEGRLSRFSKIGGEMVPHETVESHIKEILKLGPDEKAVAVTGVADSSKGEALVALVTIDVDAFAIGAQLRSLGVPNLWVPRRFVKVTEIPHLASGKLDLRRLQELAVSC